jgi:hypothetical protein
VNRPAVSTAHARRIAQAAEAARERAAQLLDAHHAEPVDEPATTARPAELRQCPRCFGPTTTPEEHCR